MLKSFLRKPEKVLTLLICVAFLVMALLGFAPTAHASSRPGTPTTKQQSKARPFGGSVTFIQPTLSTLNSGNPGWTFFNDFNGVASAFTRSNGSNPTAQAIWDFNSTSCQIWVYVPNGNATANIGYGFFSSFGFEKIIPVNQNNVSGWVFLANGTGSTNRVQIANNNGQTGTLIGVGSNTTSLKIVC